MKLEQKVALLGIIKEIGAQLLKLCDVIAVVIADSEAEEAKGEITQQKPAIAAPAPEVKKEEPKKQISFVDVRGKLASLSRAGHTKEVKELLTKHGAGKLSEIKPEDYESLLNEAEEIGNAD